MRRRWDVIVDVMKDRPHAVCAEIGIWRGLTTVRVLRRLPKIKKYYCVDPWELYPDQIKTLRPQARERTMSHEGVFREFKQSIKPWKNKIIILRKKSLEALSNVPDESLDWVFIDANHSYEYVKPDINGWTQKVKKGGVIFGHDYEDPHDVHRQKHWGVKQAVNEIFTNFKVDTNVWYTVKG